MELFNKSGIALVSTILVVGVLIACQANDTMVPTPSQIQATANTASKGATTVAEGRMVEWAKQGLPAAQRELARLYQDRPGKQDEVKQLLENASRSGDSIATMRLSEIMRQRGERHRVNDGVSGGY